MNPDPHHSSRPGAGSAALAALAGAALLAGALVYLMDRPAGSAWLLPAQWQAQPAAPGHAQPATWFGAVGLWLPSFVHAFGFSVFTALLLPRRTGFAAAACLTWALVDTLAECGQHGAVSRWLASALEAAFGEARLAVQVGRYFTQGSFALADVAAGLAGSALALVALCSFFRLDRSSNTSWGSSP